MKETLEVTTGKLLLERGLRLATAESCTGGLVGHLLTNVPGSSAYYLGSIIAYSNEMKVSLLNVSWETLDHFGAVSGEVAQEMALGVRRAMEADIGLSVTGIAGPGGATPEKPVGTTWIGLSTANVNQVRHYLWRGDRLENKEQSARAALQQLVDFLNQTPEMQEVEVTARFGCEGDVVPVRMIWNGQLYEIGSTGRRWVDERGQHILVMLVDGRVLELLFERDKGSWYIVRKTGGRFFV